MNQLTALIWLKWISFRHALNSRGGGAVEAANAFAVAVLFIFALLLSALIATGIGAGAYVLVTTVPQTRAQQLGLSGMFALLFFLWATVPLSLGGAQNFAPGRLLLYPISLRRLFLIDFIGELVSLFALFAAPAIAAVAVGVGVARAQVSLGLLVGVVAVLFGLSLNKLLGALMGVLMKSGRTRGETIVALLGVAFGLVMAFSGQLFLQVGHWKHLPAYVRWTPPGMLAVALTDGLRASDLFDVYVPNVAAIVLLSLLLIAATYRITIWSLNSGGGTGRRRKRDASSRDLRASSAGWQLPLVSSALAAVIEKELRYAMRNAQLRALALMPFVLSVTLRIVGASSGGNQVVRHRPPSYAISHIYTEGASGATSAFYIFTILSTLICNVFAYDDAGMRTFVLAPVARQTILLGKNIANSALALALFALVLILNDIVFGDITRGDMLFGALCFVYFACAFALFGNAVSLRFPRRLEYGRKLKASGLSGLLLIPFLIVILMPPLASFALGFFAADSRLKYATMAALAAFAVLLYWFLIGWQGRALSLRERDILDAVTKRRE